METIESEVQSTEAQIWTAPPSPCFDSTAWLDYFDRNARQLLSLPWDAGAELSTEEVASVAGSVQGFQLGESSEGRHLVKCATTHAEQTGDADYLKAIRLFIREEQRHAQVLGRFLQQNGIDTLKKTWPDTVFRLMRRRAGLELSVAVLVTAEIIAEVYYPALQRATGSSILHRICEQIIRDETPHIQFQCERLAILRSGSSAFRNRFVYAAQRFLFLGTCFVVWLKHRKVFQRAGFNFRQFRAVAWERYYAAEKIMRSDVDATDGSSVTNPVVQNEQSPVG